MRDAMDLLDGDTITNRPWPSISSYRYAGTACEAEAEFDDDFIPGYPPPESDPTTRGGPDLVGG